MSILNQAVVHAATNDELDLKLQDLFSAHHSLEKIKLKERLVKDDMEAYALYIARCNDTISEIENIVKESAKYLAEVKLCLAS